MGGWGWADEGVAAACAQASEQGGRALAHEASMRAPSQVCSSVSVPLTPSACTLDPHPSPSTLTPFPGPPPPPHPWVQERGRAPHAPVPPDLLRRHAHQALGLGQGLGLHPGLRGALPLRHAGGSWGVLGSWCRWGWVYNQVFEGHWDYVIGTTWWCWVGGGAGLVLLGAQPGSRVASRCIQPYSSQPRQATRQAAGAASRAAGARLADRQAAGAANWAAAAMQAAGTARLERQPAGPVFEMLEAAGRPAPSGGGPGSRAWRRMPSPAQPSAAQPSQLNPAQPSRERWEPPARERRAWNYTGPWRLGQECGRVPCCPHRQSSRRRAGRSCGRPARCRVGRPGRQAEAYWCSPGCGHASQAVHLGEGMPPWRWGPSCSNQAAAAVVRPGGCQVALPPWQHRWPLGTQPAPAPFPVPSPPLGFMVYDGRPSTHVHRVAPPVPPHLLWPPFVVSFVIFPPSTRRWPSTPRTPTPLPRPRWTAASR